MAETGSQILAYTGNANSGLGANSDIPVSADKPEFDAVQQASQNLRLFDHQNNIMLYQQKIADRDKALQLLAQGKVNAGKILPEDQKYYDEAEKAQTEAYKAIKGMQDKDGIANYLSATQKLNDLVTNAQHRWVEITKLEDEKAKKALPKDIEAYDAHIKKQRAKAIGELVDPYQTAFSFNDDEMRKLITGTQMITKGSGGISPDQPKTVTTTDANGKVTTKTVTAPLKPIAGVKQKGTAVAGSGLSAFQETPEKYYDFPTMLKRAEQLYVTDPTQTENQRQLFTKFHEASLSMQEDLIKKYNDRIKTYNIQRGIEPDADGNYPDLIKAKKINDKIVLDENPASFAAKHTLATIEGDYVQKPQKEFNKDIAEYLLGKQKADTDTFYKKSMAAATNKKADAFVSNVKSQIAARGGNEKEQTAYLDNVWKRNILGQPFLTTKYGTDGTAPVLLENKNSLPIFTFNNDGKPTLLKPIGGKPIIENKKVVGYEGGNYKQEFIYNGRQVAYPQLEKMYQAVKAANPKWDGTMDDYVKGMIEQDGSGLEIKLIGENGASDMKISRSALKAISNPVTGKGEEGVFEMPEEPEIIQ